MIENLLMQAAIPTSSNDATIVATYSTLVNAVALAVGAVAPVIVSILAFAKAKSHDPKIQEALDTGISVGKVATAMANKALENKQSIKELTELAINAAPEDMKRTLVQKQELVDKLNKEIMATGAQLKRLTPAVPPEANADTIPNLPRENDFDK